MATRIGLFGLAVALILASTGTQSLAAERPLLHLEFETIERLYYSGWDAGYLEATGKIRSGLLVDEGKSLEATPGIRMTITFPSKECLELARGAMLNAKLSFQIEGRALSWDIISPDGSARFDTGKGIKCALARSSEAPR